MSAIGYIQARAYTSSAQLPLRGVTVVVTAPDGTAIAMRTTDRSGLIPVIQIPVPDWSESREPGADECPYAQVNMFAYLGGFGPFESKNIQVFADTTTFQNIMLVPLSQLPRGTENSLNVVTPPQNL
jgi:hypothetical protein